MKPDPDETPEWLDDRLSGALAEGLHPAELSLRERRSLRERILARVREPEPEGTFTSRAEDAEWTRLSELVHIRVLRRDEEHGNQTFLVRMLPGAEIEPHVHTHDEECFVIEGSVEVGSHCLRRGDMHVARTGVAHQRVLSRTGALLLVRGEIPSDGLRPA